MFPDLLRQYLSEIVELSDAQVAALTAHYERMVRWNRSLNLTTVSGVEEAVERHYAESIFLGMQLSWSPHTVVDIGSGPGFPGFPVAVLRPECPVVLVESHQRKAVFLKECARGMSNVRVLAQRAEDVGERFDVAISRAVSYRDLRPSLGKLADQALLLTGSEEPPDDLGFEWSVGVALPWGNARFIRSGRRIRV